MDVKQQFAKKLKELRAAKGFTQATLAEAAECSQSTIRDYENRVTFPGPDMIALLAKALQVKISVLFDFDQDEVVTIGPFASSLKYLGLLNQLDKESLEYVEAIIHGAIEGQREKEEEARKTSLNKA